jgi:hypothetical protein
MNDVEDEASLGGGVVGSGSGSVGITTLADMFLILVVPPRYKRQLTALSIQIRWDERIYPAYLQLVMSYYSLIHVYPQRWLMALWLPKSLLKKGLFHEYLWSISGTPPSAFASS